MRGKQTNKEDGAERQRTVEWVGVISDVNQSKAKHKVGIAFG